MSEDWRTRCLRAEKELGRLREIEGREIVARILARRLWDALAKRRGYDLEKLFPDPAVLRILDPAFDAVETVWEKHGITVVPCDVILDPVPGAVATGSWPTQGEMYLGRWPDDSTRNLTRAQLLMMGGQNPEEPRNG